MYPLSNVLGNSLTDSYGDGYHYGGAEGAYPSRAPLSCEDPDVSSVHLGYSDISDHYTTNDEFSIDHRSGLVGIENSNFVVPTNPNVWDCTTCGVGKVEDGGRCSTSGCEGCRRPIKRRNTANKKERRRTQSINNAFTELRDCIPNVPSDTKLSKIKTLRLATSYIAYLSDLLSEEDPLRTPAAFTVDLSRRLTSRSSEDKKHKESSGHHETVASRATNSGSGMRMDSRRGKGRTGWPQHVWAMELQQ